MREVSTTPICPICGVYIEKNAYGKGQSCHPYLNKDSPYFKGCPICFSPYIINQDAYCSNPKCPSYRIEYLHNGLLIFYNDRIAFEANFSLNASGYIDYSSHINFTDEMWEKKRLFMRRLFFKILFRCELSIYLQVGVCDFNVYHDATNNRIDFSGRSSESGYW